MSKTIQEAGQEQAKNPINGNLELVQTSKNDDLKEFNERNLLDAWNAYARTKNDDPRLRSLLELHPPTIDGTVLSILLENKLQLPVFNEERYSLLDYLNKLFPQAKLSMTVVVDETREAKQAFTSKEKWDVLQEKYPLLVKLKQKLNLDFD